MRRFLLLSALLLCACAEAEAPRPAAPTAPARRPPPAPAPAAEAFDALGTEPFWAVAIGPQWISFSGLDRMTASWPNPGVRWQGRNRTWAARGPVGDIQVRLTPTTCSDGMSDRVYPYAVEVVVGGETLKGCARKGEA